MSSSVPQLASYPQEFFGEYGVTDTKISENNFVRKEGRDLFFRSVCEFALENNMCPILWDCSQVFDRRSLTMTNEAEKALYIEMNGNHQMGIDRICWHFISQIAGF